MGDKADVWQGTLALMVLKTLESMGPLHGYGIARRIEQTSGELISLNYGTLYPALLEARTGGSDLLRMGRVGEQPQGQVLHAHPRRDESNCKKKRRTGSRPRRSSLASLLPPRRADARAASVLDAAARSLRPRRSRRCRICRGTRKPSPDAHRGEPPCRHVAPGSPASGNDPARWRRTDQAGLSRTPDTALDGNPRAGPALRPPHAAQEPRIHRDRDIDPRARHWRQHRYLLDRQRSAPKPAALSASGTARRPAREQAQLRVRLHLLPQLPGLAKRQPLVFVDGRLARIFLQHSPARA